MSDMRPQPKLPRERKRSVIDTRDMMLSKSHPLIDPKYRLFVRQHPCALYASAECMGDIVCAHLTPPGMASRSHKQSDAFTVALCARHHDAIDLRIYIEPEVRNELLIFCWCRALELREEWHRLNAAINENAPRDHAIDEAQKRGTT